MTLEELIAAERRAVDATISIMWDTDGKAAKRRKVLYAKMRAYSEKVQRQPLPNSVSVEDAWLQLSLRAKDLGGISPPEGYFLPL